MAGGPYKKKSGAMYLVWSDAKLYPTQPSVKEYLRTENKQEAQRRKVRLEELYKAGKHDPWKSKWYENGSIKPFIEQSLLSGDTSTINQGTSIALGIAIEQYIDYQINRPKGWTTPLSQQNYAIVLRKFADTAGPTLLVSSIESGDVYKFLHRTHPITGKPLSSETVNSDRAKIKGFLNWCQRQGWISQVPEIETAAPQQKVPKFFYEEEFLRICWLKIAETEKNLKAGYGGEAHQLRFVLAWQLIAGTGMRLGEAVSIRLDDMHGDQILVGSTYQGKTNEQRMVPVLYEAQSAVSVLTDPSYRQMDPALAGSDLLLGIDSVMTKRRLSRELKRCHLKLYPGRGKRTAYNLRDFFAVRFLCDSQNGNQDFRLLQLRNILGHSSITTTEKYLKSVPHRLDLQLPENTDILNVLG